KIRRIKHCAPHDMYLIPQEKGYTQARRLHRYKRGMNRRKYTKHEDKKSKSISWLKGYFKCNIQDLPR
ncbi:hypothetical protein SK128_028258, partial [Halocaridina rubra]